MVALNESVRDGLRAKVRDSARFRPSDFVWEFPDVESTTSAALVEQLGGASNPQRSVLMRCKSRDRPFEFRVVVIGRTDAGRLDLVCEFEPATTFTSETRPVASVPLDIEKSMTEWLFACGRELDRVPPLARQMDDIVESVAAKLDGLDAPFGGARRERLASQLNQISAYATVLRASADALEPPALQRRVKTCLVDARRDCEILGEQLASAPRSRVLRWLIGIVARLDYAWLEVSGAEDEPHHLMHAIWETAVDEELQAILGKDYRTLARISFR